MTSKGHKMVSDTPKKPCLRVAFIVLKEEKESTSHINCVQRWQSMKCWEVRKIVMEEGQDIRPQPEMSRGQVMGNGVGKGILEEEDP